MLRLFVCLALILVATATRFADGFDSAEPGRANEECGGGDEPFSVDAILISSQKVACYAQTNRLKLGWRSKTIIAWETNCVKLENSDICHRSPGGVN